MHIVLLGDSTFDNWAYADGEPDVAEHLRAQLGLLDQVTLLARDGDTTTDIERQLTRLPTDATHLVLSVGGNDALQYLDVLAMPANTVSEALSMLTDALEVFEPRYRRCLHAVLSNRLPTVVCTIYNGCFTDPAQQRTITTTARLFNDVITQAALGTGCSIIDLRQVCNEREDYWNPIEPGAEGGRKIAKAVFESLGAN